MSALNASPGPWSNTNGYFALFLTRSTKAPAIMDRGLAFSLRYISITVYSTAHRDPVPTPCTAAISLDPW
jgi:hypothetical protein